MGVSGVRINILDLLNLSDDELFQLTPENFTAVATVKEYAAEKKIGFC